MRICDLLTNAWEPTLNKSMPNGVTHYKWFLFLRLFKFTFSRNIYINTKRCPEVTKKYVRTSHDLSSDTSSTHRPSTSISSHVTEDLEACWVMRGEHWVDAILSLPAGVDVTAVSGSGTCQKMSTPASSMHIKNSGAKYLSNCTWLRHFKYFKCLSNYTWLLHCTYF